MTSAPLSGNEGEGRAALWLLKFLDCAQCVLNLPRVRPDCVAASHQFSPACLCDALQEVHISQYTLVVALVDALNVTTNSSSHNARQALDGFRLLQQSPSNMQNMCRIF